MPEYSESIASAVEDFLREDDWHFTFDENYGQFRMYLKIHGKMKQANYIIKIKPDGFLTYAVLPIGADEAQYPLIAEFVCRANYGLVQGGFEFDFTDGEIRYRCYTDCSGLDSPTHEMIKNSIYCPAAMIERYSKGLLNLIMEISDNPEKEVLRSERPDDVMERLGSAVDIEPDLIEQLKARFADSDSSDSDDDDDDDDEL